MGPRKRSDHSAPLQRFRLLRQGEVQAQDSGRVWVEGLVLAASRFQHGEPAGGAEGARSGAGGAALDARKRSLPGRSWNRRPQVRAGAAPAAETVAGEGRGTNRL